jgi:hypothetical protein
MRLHRFGLAVVYGWLLIFGASNANAQIFGPKNLEECILEKMKGQAPNMAGVARTACLKSFPQETLLTDQQVTSTWCDGTDDSISACVTVIKPDYKITRAEAAFTRAKCDTPEANFLQPDVEASASPPLFGTTYKFSVSNARYYKCAKFYFYGYRKP